jgi:two-component system heavy metal sensor histidine kinase CusS
LRTLRARLALSFAAAAAATLVLFSGIVLAVLTFSEVPEAARYSSEELAENLRGVLIAMAVAAPIAVGGAAAGGLWLARRAVAPLKEASARARAARASELDLALPLSGTSDEWDELAATLNILLADARGAMERIRRFTADAAHELRTPLTAILGEAELAMRRERTPDELRTSLQIVREEAERLAALLDALLTLARADGGTLVPIGGPGWPIEAAVREAAALALNDSRRSRIEGGTIEISGAGDLVRGDRVLVVRAIRNLLDNALRHGGGRASVDLAADDRAVHIRLEDSGGGIPERLRPVLFQRFARGDESRSSGGFGLGLAITRAIVEAHGGGVRLVPSESGAAFEVDLPRAPPGEMAT